VLLPAWSIMVRAERRLYLARHYRVIAFDGQQRSVGPAEGADAYIAQEFVADAIAVLDATGTERAAIVGLARGSRGDPGAQHPDRGSAMLSRHRRYRAHRSGGTEANFEERYNSCGDGQNTTGTVAAGLSRLAEFFFGILSRAPFDYRSRIASAGPWDAT
jgi:hypothetical protein